MYNRRGRKFLMELLPDIEHEELVDSEFVSLFKLARGICELTLGFTSQLGSNWHLINPSRSTIVGVRGNA